MVKGLKLTLVTGIIMVGGLLSCGGSGSGIFGGFDTVLVGITQVDPPKLESDTLILLDNNGDGICDGFSFQDDSLQVTIKSQTIKDSQGQPVTANASPVYIDRYRLTFISAVNNNNCERYAPCKNLFANPYEQFTSITIEPDQEVQVGIPVALASWKSTVLSQYCATSLDNCIYNVVLEMRGREVLTGSDKTIRATFNVQFANYNQGNSQGATADANCVLQ